MVILVIKLYIT